MKTSKLKTLIIIILVIVNGFLLSVAIPRLTAERYQMQQEKRILVRLLRESGIQADVDAIPDEAKLKSLAAGRDGAVEARVVRALLGETAFVDRGGGIYSYESAAGEAEFREFGDFSVELTSGSKKYSTPDTAKKLFKDLGFEALNIRGFTEDGAEFAAAEQATDGAALFNCTVKARYDESGLRSVSGTWITLVEPSSREELPAMGVASALVSFLDSSETLGIVCGEITDAEAGYILSRSSPVAQLSPVWMIKADTGTYYVSAITGEILSQKVNVNN